MHPQLRLLCKWGGFSSFISYDLSHCRKMCVSIRSTFLPLGSRSTFCWKRQRTLYSHLEYCYCMAGFNSFREGKKPDKMDSRCGQSTKLNVDYFVCASVCFKICHSLSIFEETIIGKLNLWWCRKTWDGVAQSFISFCHFRKALSTQS